jgi:hypothetical protein
MVKQREKSRFGCKSTFKICKLAYGKDSSGLQIKWGWDDGAEAVEGCEGGDGEDERKHRAMVGALELKEPVRKLARMGYVE